MNAYFVRLTGNNEVVGLFCASSLQELAQHVDAVCNVDAVEYAVAGSGGIFVSDQTAATWPLPEWDEDSGEPGPGYATGLEQATFSENWYYKLAPSARLNWKPLDWHD